MAHVPPYNELLWPTLLAVRTLGHTATLDEIDERVIAEQGFTDEQVAVLHKDGPRSEIEYRLAWARTYLKGMGTLANAARGVWENDPGWARAHRERDRTSPARIPGEAPRRSGTQGGSR